MFGKKEKSRYIQAERGHFKMEFYRYEEYRTGENSIELAKRTFKMVKETKCGYWIKEEGSFCAKKRWVSKTSKKRYAHPSKAEAVYSFKRRKEMHIFYLEQQIRRAKQALRIAERLENNDDGYRKILL